MIQRTAVLAAADTAVLLLCRPDVPRLAADLAHPRAWVADAGADVVCAHLAAAGVWLVAAWLGVGLLCAAASGLPGVGGRWAARLTRMVLPRAVRGLLAGGAGLGVLLAPVAAGAASVHVAARAPAQTAQAPASASAGPVLPSPAWPVDPPVAAPHSRTTTRPATNDNHDGARRRASPPHARGPARRSGDRAHEARHETVTVARGDSLWLIAARRLGPSATPEQVAAAWPRWYAANRTAIGADPALVRPGQVLHVPTRTEPTRVTNPTRAAGVTTTKGDS